MGVTPTRVGMLQLPVAVLVGMLQGPMAVAVLPAHQPCDTGSHQPRSQKNGRREGFPQDNGRKQYPTNGAVENSSLTAEPDCLQRTLEGARHSARRCGRQRGCHGG